MTGTSTKPVPVQQLRILYSKYGTRNNRVKSLMWATRNRVHMLSPLMLLPLYYDIPVSAKRLQRARTEKAPGEGARWERQGRDKMDKMHSRLRGESTPHLEEHLASWTKGCEGQKGSGNTPLGLNKSPRGEGRRERISSLVVPAKFLVVPAKAGTHASWQDWIPAFAGMTEGASSATGQLAGPWAPGTAPSENRG